MAGSNTNYHAVIFKHIKINPSNAHRFDHRFWHVEKDPGL